VETGDARDMYYSAHHPYTWGLLQSIARMDQETERLRPIKGLPPSLLRPPSGCRFHPRCPYVMDVCRTTFPELTAVPSEPQHLQRCWLDEDTKRREGEKLLSGAMAEAS